jgi:hypothetical protein
MIRQLLSRQHFSLVQFRNCLATMIATLGTNSSETGRSFQSCDVFFNADASRGFLELTGGTNLIGSHSKPDQIRKGRTFRFGRSKDISKDSLYQLGLWMDTEHLRPRPGYRKSLRKHSHCSICPLLSKFQTDLGPF